MKKELDTNIINLDTNTEPDLFKSVFGYQFLTPKKILFLFFCVVFFSCNPTKHLKKEELFLKKVDFVKDTKKIAKEDLINIVKQKPNRKILGLFRFHLGVNNLFKPDSDSKIKKNVGEPPVVFDPELTKKGQKQLKLYLDSKGYFDNKVEVIKKVKKNKVSVTYQINSGDPYLIKEVNHVFDDKKIEEYVLYEKKNSLIKVGSPYEIDILDKERDRISTNLKNRGYYHFNKNFIRYKIDSTGGDKSVIISTHVLNTPLYEKETTALTRHRKYFIKDLNIYVNKNYKDSLFQNVDTTHYKDISVLYKNKLVYKPKMLHHANNLTPGELYKLEKHKDTYKHFSELKLFKNINIGFEDVDSNKLNVTVFLTPKPVKSTSIETIGTNSGGILGVEGSLIYQNKNLIKGGEYFTVKLKGGLAIQRLVNESNENNEILGLPFNTIEIGPEINLDLPRFLLPVQQWKFSKRANPKTNFNALLNFQKRPEYDRNLAKISFGYFWNETSTKRHFVYPITVSYIKLRLTDDFKNELTQEDNPFIINSYTDHFISSTYYSFIFNNQKINKIRNFNFFKFNIELAGNALSAFNSLTNSKKSTPENGYEIFNIRYAQFAKLDLDFRDYTPKKNASFVKRLLIGYGLPYGNLNVLPFEKSYYGGGANGIRAWQARSLGPGSLSDSLLTPSSQIGELKIEGNLEYRFDITKLFEGALFVDAGNIWTLKPDEQRPNAEIKLDRFYQDIAIGIGAGLRLDFNFFIIRFDLAARLKDPSSPQPKKINLNVKSPTLNLGIGYPF